MQYSNSFTPWVVGCLGSQPLARRYIAHRESGVGAKHALEAARRELAYREVPAWDDEDFRYNGLHVRVKVDYDPDGASSMMTGKWCEDGWNNNHSNGDYIKNPDCSGRRDRGGRTYAWYKPMTSVHEHFRALVKDCKMGSALAYEKAWEYAKADMEREKESVGYFCKVELYSENEHGVETQWAEATCGGIDDEDYAKHEVAFELMSEAFDEAVSCGYKMPMPPRPVSIGRPMRQLDI